MDPPSKWNNLPNEIWKLILSNLVSTDGFQKFLHINKPIFKIAAPLL